MNNIYKIEENHRRILFDISKLNSFNAKIVAFLHYYKELVNYDDKLVTEAYVTEIISLIIPLVENYSPFGSNPQLSTEILEMLIELKRFPMSNEDYILIDENILRIQNEIEELNIILNGNSTDESFTSSVIFPLLDKHSSNKYFTGNIETIKISLNQLSGLKEDEFLVIPSLPKVEEQSLKQIKISWQYAKSFIKDNFNVKIPFLQISIQFSRKYGIYEGDSHGLALSLGFISELSNYLNLKIKYKINNSAIFTGSMLQDGNLDSISSNIIERKTLTAFYSKCVYFIIPHKNYLQAKAVIEREKINYGNKKINIVPIANVSEIFEHGEIVKNVTEPVSTYFYRKIRSLKYSVPILILLMMIIILPIYYFKNAQTNEENDFIETAVQKYNLDKKKLSPILNDNSLLSLKLDKVDLNLSDSSLIDTFKNISSIENRFQEKDKALYFSGDSSFIRLNKNINLKSGFPISISMWIKKEGWDRGWIFANNFNTNTYSGIWLGFGYGYILSMNFGSNKPTAVPGSRRSVYIKKPLLENNWYHIVGIIISNKIMYIYINNQKAEVVFDGSATEVLYQNVGIPAFGEYKTSTVLPLTYFKGAIDDFRFYNRELSEREISKLFHEKY